FFSSRRRHTRFSRDWSSDVCSSDLRFHDLRPAVLASKRLNACHFLFFCAGQLTAITSRNSLGKSNGGLSHCLLSGIESIRGQIRGTKRHPGVRECPIGNSFFQQSILHPH